MSREEEEEEEALVCTEAEREEEEEVVVVRWSGSPENGHSQQSETLTVAVHLTIKVEGDRR